MISQQQIIKRLKELKNYRFVSYHNEIAKGQHLVKLRVMAFVEIPQLMHQADIFFVVTEREGYLSARSMDYALIVDKLS